MKNPTTLQVFLDHARAFLWSGRPVVIRYLDRNNYFLNSDKFGGSGGAISDGNCSPRLSVSTVRIFLPLSDDRLMTLRHECGHIRFNFIKRSPAALSEALRLFRTCEPEDAALYDDRGGDFDPSGEGVVRLADRIRNGQHVPHMSAELSKLVEEVVAPAPGSALAFILVATVILLCLGRVVLAVA